MKKRTPLVTVARSHPRFQGAQMAKSKRITKYQWLIQAIASHQSDACILWPFSKDPKGYGCIVVPDEHRLVKVHRAAFRIVNGHWPTPIGLHSCDTPGCFNPRHIIEGTQAQNSIDMKAKGRSKRGLEKRNTKLNPGIVLAIRADNGKSSQSELGRKYGVAPITIHRILRRERWTYL